MSHGSYLLNLASPDRDRLSKSLSTLIDEIDRADLLGISCFVCHPGSHRSAGDSAGLDILAATLNRALSERPDSPVSLLLENTAGSGHLPGGRFEPFRTVIDRIEDPSRIGKGRLGPAIFSYLVRSEDFQDRPMLLETPGGEEGFREDLAMFRSFVDGEGRRVTGCTRRIPG